MLFSSGHLFIRWMRTPTARCVFERGTCALDSLAVSIVTFVFSLTLSELFSYWQQLSASGQTMDSKRRKPFHVWLHFPPFHRIKAKTENRASVTHGQSKVEFISLVVVVVVVVVVLGHSNRELLLLLYFWFDFNLWALMFRLVKVKQLISKLTHSTVHSFYFILERYSV